MSGTVPIRLCYEAHHSQNRSDANSRIGHRHVINAQEYIDARATSAYQGDSLLEIPNELRQDPDGRGFPAERVQRWQTYIEQ